MNPKLYTLIFWLDRLSLYGSIVTALYFVLTANWLWAVILSVAAIAQGLIIKFSIAEKLGKAIGIHFRRKKEWTL